MTHTPFGALSIRQPWAWLIVHGYKDAENRSWSIGYRGRILIHASRARDERAYEVARRIARRLRVPLPDFDALERGGFVGVATITACAWTRQSRIWRVRESYAWLLSDARSRAFIEAPGRLGIFTPVGGVVDALACAGYYDSDGARHN